MPNHDIRVTIAVENVSPDEQLKAEHGLSFWVESTSARILFDTGQGPALAHNTPLLGVPLAEATAIVLSHGHYDHTGGLAHALPQAPSAPLYAHPVALLPRFSQSRGASRPVGIPKESLAAVRAHKGPFIDTHTVTKVAKDIYATGPIPRSLHFENNRAQAFTNGTDKMQDPFLDDQALFFHSSQGTVVLLGCAHAGAINTLRYIHRITKRRPICAVFGGMHLKDASPYRLDHTVSALAEYASIRLYLGHCTGDTAIEQLRKSFPNRCLPCHAGTTVTFTSASAQMGVPQSS